MLAGIALHLQLLQLAHLTDQWSTFYKTRMNCLNGQYLFSSAIKKKERATWKISCGISQWKVWYIVYNKNMKIKIWVCWCENNLFYVIAVLVLIHMLCAFKIWYCQKQHIYCFLAFGFIKVIIFVINPSGSYSTFVGADLEYQNSLHFDRSSYSELRNFNFESTLKLWWRRAGDFDGSEILVTTGGF